MRVFAPDRPGPPPHVCAPGGERRAGRPVRLRTTLSFGLERNAALLFWGLFFVQAAFGTSDRFKTLFIEDLGATPAAVGIILGVSEAIRLVFLVVAGTMSDRMKPSTMLRMRWGSVVNSLFWLTAFNWWMLMPAFVAQAAANFAWPAVSRVIDESGAPEDRQRRFLLVYSVAPGVALLGAPVLGAILAEAYGLRSVFVVLTIGTAISCVFFTMVRPQQQTRRSSGGSYRAAMRHRPTVYVCLLTFTSTFVTWLGLTLAPNYLHNEAGMSYGLIGSYGALVAIGSIGAALVLARIRRLSHSLNGTIAAGAFLPLVFALLLFDTSATVVGLAYLASGIAGVVQQTYAPAVSEVTPAAERVRAFALIEAMIAAGVMCAGFGSGALYAVSPRLPLLVAAILAVATLGLTLLVRRSIRAWKAAGSPMPVAAT